MIESVELIGTKPSIILSRTSPLFAEKLFEQEIPEVFDGLITIKKVVRIPGEKAKFLLILMMTGLIQLVHALE